MVKHMVPFGTLKSGAIFHTLQENSDVPVRCMKISAPDGMEVAVSVSAGKWSTVNAVLLQAHVFINKTGAVPVGTAVRCELNEMVMYEGEMK